MIRDWTTRAVRSAGRLLTRGRPQAPVTSALLAACCLLFLVSPAAGLNPAYGTGEEALAAQRAYFHRWGVIPADLFEDSPWSALTPATALFVHGGWVHLLGNMLFLYVFGAMTEERMGRLRFLLFYLCSGYLALLGYALANTDSDQPLVGASGAISAVLGAFLFLFPRARVISLLPFAFFLPLRFPAWLVLPFWAALQWMAAGRAGDGPGVAYLAHLVGFGLGFCYAWLRFGRKPGAGRAGPRVRTAPATAAPEGENQP
ncbi:rhomboid family intramembrane serine protease [Streptomyces sp. NPDC048182]|uniref:rhomboid family intramembrane serine protease n=1 Tax=unclassified Streptomyces TaxID=2593676 RepID=UPI00339EF913